MLWIVLSLYVICVTAFIILGKDTKGVIFPFILIFFIVGVFTILAGVSISQSTNTREVESSKTYKIAQGSTLEYAESSVKFIAEHEDGALEPLEIQGTIKIMNQGEIQGIIEVDSVYKEWGGDFWFPWTQNITENKLTVK